MSLLYSLLIFSLLTWPGSLLVRADTPLFYLVASGQGSANLLPVRPNGGLNGASLTGTAPIGTFYFDSEGGFHMARPTPDDPVIQGYVAAIPNAQGCTGYGGLAFVAGSSSNKCASMGLFTLRPLATAPQLGSKLVFNGKGGFYACGSGLDIWYEPKPGLGPPGLTCTPIDLYPIPVV